ncbi:hypothetical protein [Dokdonella soli]|uniref:Transmembrane protein n=1 Tax=Dokdonella soli TaxID=529810 RepID=A0ABN1IFQ8_9GAMM
MPRFTSRDYRRQMLVLTTIYVAVMLLVWPHARNASSLPWKIVLALAPVLPVVQLIWLMAKRAVHSDELEQRVHLVALSTATGFICVLCLVGGFLCAAGVLTVGGDVLIWVFPVLCVSYGAARWQLARRYGGLGCE